jgi:hypothetical protein
VGAKGGSRDTRGRARCAFGIACIVLIVASRVAAVAGESQTSDPPSEIRGGAHITKEAVPSPPDAWREVPGGMSIPRGGAASRDALVRAEAKRVGLPAEIVDSVMAVESGYDPSVIGADGEIGLMQVLPSTARMMGFAGTLAELAAPATNIHYGVTYLAQAWQLAGHDLCTALMKYRAGHGETRFSYRSVDYCMKVRARLAARGYVVGGIVPVPTFGEPTCRHCAASKPRDLDLAALNNNLNRIVLQVSVFRPLGR